MRQTLTALLLVCAATAGAAERLTVDQAVAAALEHNANVKNTRLEIEKAQTRIDAAKTKRLPALSFEAIGGESLSNPSIEVESGKGETTRIDMARTFNMFAIARVTQPLTQLHAIGLGIKLNEAALEVDRERERAARLAIAAEVNAVTPATTQPRNVQSQAGGLHYTACLTRRSWRRSCSSRRRARTSCIARGCGIVSRPRAVGG